MTEPMLDEGASASKLENATAPPDTYGARMALEHSRGVSERDREARAELRRLLVREQRRLIGDDL